MALFGGQRDISLFRTLNRELINEIIIFELDNDNKNIVNKRKQLWFYMKQLKDDKCLNKFILFDI